MRQVPTAPAAGKSDSVRQYQARSINSPSASAAGRRSESGGIRLQSAGPYCRTESVRIFRADSRGPPRKGAHAAGADGTCGRKIGTLFGNIRARSINSPFSFCSRAPLLRSGASGCSRAGPYCRTESVRIFRADSRGPPRKGAHAAGADGTCGRKIRTLFGNIRPLDQLPFSFCSRAPLLRSGASGCSRAFSHIAEQSRSGFSGRTAAGHRERAPMRQVPTAPAAGKSGLCSAISGPARSTPPSASAAGRRS